MVYVTTNPAHGPLGDVRACPIRIYSGLMRLRAWSFHFPCRMIRMDLLHMHLDAENECTRMHGLADLPATAPLLRLDQ